LARVLNRMILGITRHWLALVNAVMLLVLGLAVLAPWLMAHGQASAGRLLYRLYQPLCHQLPERSFFLAGPRAVYDLAELGAHLGYEAPLRWLGDAQLGYKVAFCERDTAMYAGWLLAGLAFGLLRRPDSRTCSGGMTSTRGAPSCGLRPLSWRWLLLTMLPMAIDGTGQLFGLWESTWWLRVATGLLFAAGTVWFAYPLLEQGMNDAQEIALRSLEDGHAADR